MLSFIYTPDVWSPQYKIMIGLFTVAIPVQFYHETISNAPYSKFFSEKTVRTSVRSRLGMFLLYTPAFLVGLYLGNKTVNEGPCANYTGYMCAAHFLKRLMEVLFVHKYSGSMALVEMVFPGSIGYALHSATIIMNAKPLPPHATSSVVGIGAFVTGSLGNFYHHFLLRQLRSGSKESEKRYVVPSGGLFDYVACPHYLCEVVSWVGISCYSRNLVAYLATGMMAAYLAGRSKKTTEFYRSKLPEEYPETRRNMIPFVY